jgi:selenocysteine lyase/cysteine desulfurase
MINFYVKKFLFFKIIDLNFEYRSNIALLNFLKNYSNIKLVQVDINLPTNKEKIIKSIEEVLKEHDDIKLASFDHISSFPSLELPIKEIISITRKKGIPTIM